MHGKNKNPWKLGHTLGILFTLLYVICFAWYFIHPVQQEMHLAMFQMSYFGFNDMGIVSFISGLVQTYIWGYLFIGVWKLSMMLGGLKKDGCCKDEKCGK